ncbi:MAG: hypothetical protein ACYTBJ_26225 [Planctomycetota bacterium]|jgi:hypothetical protein
MAKKHYDAITLCTPSVHFGAKSPSKLQLNYAREALLSGTWFKQCGQLMNFSGYAGTTYNGNYNNNFYIIYPVLDPPGNDDKIQIGVDVACWRITDNSNAAATNWNGGTTTQYGQIQNSTQTEIEVPAGTKFFQADEIAYNLNVDAGVGADTNTGKYGYTKFTITGTTVSHLSAFVLPRYTPAYQGDTPAASSFDNQYGMSNDTFNPMQPLRGCSDFDSTNGSVGALVQHQNSRDDATSSYAGATAQCLFQWGHPAGLLCSGVGGSIADLPMFGEPIINAVPTPVTVKVKGRNLRGATSKKLDLVFVGRWDTGTNIKVKT